MKKKGRKIIQYLLRLEIGEAAEKLVPNNYHLHSKFFVVPSILSCHQRHVTCKYFPVNIIIS